jgi:hypothetical protein
VEIAVFGKGNNFARHEDIQQILFQREFAQSGFGNMLKN